MATERFRDLRPKGSSTVALSPEDRDAVIRVAFAENLPNYSTDDIAAVASVVKNRAVKSSKAPLSVVMAPKQFSAAHKKLAGKNTRFWDIQPGSPEYEKVGQIVDGVFNGTIADPTGGADHYYALAGMKNKKPPGWAKKMQDVVQVGPHTFGRIGRSLTPPGDIPAASLDRAQIGKLQEFLRSTVDESLGVDGDYGPRTTAAVKAFQEMTGAQRKDGVIDTSTLVAVKNFGQTMGLDVSSLAQAVPPPSKAPAANPLRTRLSPDVQRMLQSLQQKRDAMNAAPPIPRAKQGPLQPRPRMNPVAPPTAPVGIDFDDAQRTRDRKSDDLMPLLSKVIGDRPKVVPAQTMTFPKERDPVQEAFDVGRGNKAWGERYARQARDAFPVGNENYERKPEAPVVAAPKVPTKVDRPSSARTPMTAYDGLQKAQLGLVRQKEEGVKKTTPDRLPGSPMTPSGVDRRTLTPPKVSRPTLASPKPSVAPGMDWSPRGITQAQAFSIRDEDESANLGKKLVEQTTVPRPRLKADVRPRGYDPAVESLQRDLAARGFNPGKIDGFMGPKTQAAMRASERGSASKTLSMVAGPAPSRSASAAKSVASGGKTPAKKTSSFQKAFAGQDASARAEAARKRKN